MMLQRRFIQGAAGIAVAAIFVLLPPLTAFAGFGISPGVVEIDNALRGSSFNKVFVLSRSNPETNLLIKVQTSGEIADWFQFEKGSQFTYPAGKQQFPVKATISVPPGTPNGAYSGEVRFTGIEQQTKTDSQEAAVNVQLGAIAQVKLTVTDKEIKSFRVLGVQVAQAVVGKPLLLGINIQNTGNVKVQPDHLVVEIFDKFQKIQLGQFRVTEFEGWAPVQNTARINAKVPWSIPEAENYFAIVSVFDHQNNLVERATVPFQAKTETGGELAGVELPANFWLYLLVGALAGAFVIALAAIVVMFVYMKKREK